jgi:hypothetical protein
MMTRRISEESPYTSTDRLAGLGRPVKATLVRPAGFSAGGLSEPWLQPLGPSCGSTLTVPTTSLPTSLSPSDTSLGNVAR